MIKMKTQPPMLRGAAFAAFFVQALLAADFDEIASTRTPLGLTSQQINNTTKALTAPKPPMGWNSWDNFGLDITEAEFKGQVDYVASHLRQFGYAYMVIDAGGY